MPEIKIKCPDCKGNGDCPAHLERYIDVDRTMPCEVCKGLGICPTCLGEGELSEEYLDYMQGYRPDPRD